jgi:hypothetical protein
MDMPTGKNLFTNRTITTTSAAPSAILPVDRVDFISVGVQVTAGNGQAVIGVQWSFDGDVWTNPADAAEDIIGTFTGPAYVIKRMPIKAPYWRLAAQWSGWSPSFTVTANALVW